MGPAVQVAGWEVAVAADVFIKSQQLQERMHGFLKMECQAAGVSLAGWRCEETPKLMMPVGVAGSLRWAASLRHDCAVFWIRPGACVGLDSHHHA